MKQLKLYKAKKLNNSIIHIPGSKSESNRALIINALCDNPGSIDNLAIARDTAILQQLLQADSKIYDAQDAGTVMRFMTAYLAVSKEHVEITGSERMKRRPIGILKEALGKIGVGIDYLGEPGYPPLAIEGLAEQQTESLSIESNVSSQYISALLMIAPKLPRGLSLTLTGKPVSTPYIDMTVSIMQHFGVQVKENGGTYKVAHQPYRFMPYRVESDWSGASYWYSIFALSDLTTLRLYGLKPDSFQGDSVVASLMEGFGVKTTFKDDVAVLTKTEAVFPDEIDFIKCPDLVQTFAVLCAVLGHRCTFFGLKTLKIKETDRVMALKMELQKLGSDFIEHDNRWEVMPIPSTAFTTMEEVQISTYEDHRMAMAFAALATKIAVIFDDAEVVNKSYPTFWEDLALVGFKLA